MNDNGVHFVHRAVCVVERLLNISTAHTAGVPRPCLSVQPESVWPAAEDRQVSLVVRQARCQAGWAHCTNAAILHDARHAAWCRVLSAVTFVCVGGKAAQGM